MSSSTAISQVCNKPTSDVITGAEARLHYIASDTSAEHSFMGNYAYRRNIFKLDSGYMY